MNDIVMKVSFSEAVRNFWEVAGLLNFHDPLNMQF
jgi:hypothetical protein